MYQSNESLINLLVIDHILSKHNINKFIVTGVAPTPVEVHDGNITKRSDLNTIKGEGEAVTILVHQPSSEIINASE